MGGHVHSIRDEILERDQRPVLATGLRIHGYLREQNEVLLGCHADLTVERVMLDPHHAVSIHHKAALVTVLQRQNAVLALRLVLGVAVLVLRLLMLLLHGYMMLLNMRATNAWEHLEEPVTVSCVPAGAGIQQ